MEGTVLFVGAGRHQRRAIERARELGCASSRSTATPDAPGLAAANDREVVDFTDVEAVERGRTRARRRRRADRLRRPRGARRRRGRRGARACRASEPRPRTLMTHKVAMRRVLRRARRAASRAFAAVRSFGERHGALEVTGLAGRAEARRLGRPARRLPDRLARRPRGAPARGARGVAQRRGDRRVVPRRARAERPRGRARRPRRAADALGPAAPAGDRLRRRLGARLPVDDLRRRARARGADRGLRRSTRSGCATGSRSRS